MKNWIHRAGIITGIFILSAFNWNFENTSMPMNRQSIYDIAIHTLEGEALDLSQFKGRKLLIVNVASECGFTPQYAGLQELHEQFEDQLAVIGVPCNQFGAQEPGSAEEIRGFCQKNYGVQFTITEKVEVKGEGQHPLYGWLTRKSLNGVQDSNVEWNFHKYLIDENGQLLAVFPSSVIPQDEQILKYLEI